MFVAECRSSPESGARAASSCVARLLHSPGTKMEPGVIRVTLPYIRTDIPLFVVFRALGFVADKDILEHVVYDFDDHEMMELLRPSIEEAFVIQSQAIALDYIGKRGSAVGVTREKRIKYAKEILQKELLPHVGVDEDCETKKAYYMGYIVHRLLLCALGRRNEDDRDHFGNKRMDLSGPLIGMLFRQLFRKLSKDVRLYCQRCVDSGKDIQLTLAVKAKTITSGLKYSLSTGNWWGRFDRNVKSNPRAVDRCLHQV
jgi:DNA-directed RNA polymerase II subunit RPB2